MSIETNIAVKNAAIEYIELGEGIASEHDVRKFWVAVAAMANERAGLVRELAEMDRRDRLAPMTTKEARQFGETKIEFGAHSGKRVADVPLSYLQWLSDKAQFQIDVRRYFESDAVQREVDDD